MAKLNADSVVKTVNTTDVDAVKKTTTVTRKKYEPDDLVSVRSTTQGTLLLPGSKSKILYTWESYGDVVQVEYQDLYTLKASRSNYLYKPFFVIEYEELLEDPRWSDLKKVYDNMFTKSDISTILNLPPADFKETLSTVPDGFKDAVKMEVATRLEAGTFDSIKKIKIVDEICGTDLFSIM